jgi:hypothetical protein
MNTGKSSSSISDDFLAYWESLGFFGYSSSVIPQKFMLLFDIARIIETSESGEEINKYIANICDESKEKDVDEEIILNRIDRSAPLGDKMELDHYRNIFDLKKALPRELASDDDIFDVKLFTKTLMVQRYFETSDDDFRYINTTLTGESDSNKFEQKFYLLLDRSKSMDKKMRFFYAKCIVTELLRRKLGSGARLYYRSFDSKTGPLFRITDRNDFPAIIREILLTQTGGSRTNIQMAVLQAIDDIEYDSDMMHSEILIVTDGLSSIDKNLLKTKLGSIKLNTLKIGDDKTDPDLSVMVEMLKQDNINIDSLYSEMDKVKDSGRKTKEQSNSGFQKESISPKEAMLRRVIQKFQSKLDRDLNEVSFRYFDIKDLDPSLLYIITPEQEAGILRAINDLEECVKISTDQDDKVILYKKVYFFSQYISMLMESSKDNNANLKGFLDRLYKMKSLLLEDQEVFLIISEIPELLEDPKLMKMAGKEAMEMMKKMTEQKKKLTFEQMKMAKLQRGGALRKAKPGELLQLLFLKIIETLKKIFYFTSSRFISKS